MATGITTFWIGNAIASLQVDTLTVGGTPAAGNTVTVTVGSATINKSITYTVQSGDTTTTIATALLALLVATTAPPEFQEITWTSSNAIITATSALAGRPFLLSSSATGATTLTHAAVTPNSSPSDITNPVNWLRNGVTSLPQNGDDVQVSDSSVPMLWNLAGLASLQFNSYFRFNSMTGQIGLPENNPAGYYEYRPTYFQFSTTSGNACNVVIGIGSGNGPSIERYNLGNIQSSVQVQPTGSTINLLSQNATSTFTVNGAVVNIATLPGETANVSGGVTCVNGAVVSLGKGVTLNGTLQVFSASIAFCACVPSTINVNAGRLTMNTTSPVPGTVNIATIQNGSYAAWPSNCGIAQLFLQTSSTFDKSVDSQKVTIQNSAIDATCVVLDPWNAITYRTPVVVNGPVPTGVVTFGPGRTVQVV